VGHTPSSAVLVYHALVSGLVPNVDLLVLVKRHEVDMSVMMSVEKVARPVHKAAHHLEHQLTVRKNGSILVVTQQPGRNAEFKRSWRAILNVVRLAS
jgi:hypothetical protein